MIIDDPSVEANNSPPSSVKDLLRLVEYANKSFIKTILVGHSLMFLLNATSDVMRSLLTHHFTSGNCFGNPATACRNTVADLIPGNCILTNRTQFQIYLMSLLVKSFTLRTFRRIFNVQNIYHESSFTLSKF